MGQWDDGTMRNFYMRRRHHTFHLSLFSFQFIPRRRHLSHFALPCYHYAYERAIREEQHLVGIHLVVRNAVKHCEIVVLGSLIAT